MPNEQIGQRKVYKDDAVEAIDRFFSGNSISLERAFSIARGILGDTSRSLADVVVPDLHLTDEQVQHFRTHWPKPLQEEMRGGYTEAINLADGNPRLPIETFWVTGPSDAFQVLARKEATKVTVHVFIPPEVEREARQDWPD